MASPTLQRDILGARTSFQRLRDAKILHGWIDAIDGPSVTVRSSPTVSLSIGERFLFRCAALSGEVSFEAEMIQSSDDDAAALLSLASKGRVMLDMDDQTFTFELVGRITVTPLTCDPRYLCEQGSVTLGTDGIEASLRDVSPAGLGVISPVAFPRGTIVPIMVYTAAGQVAAEAEVRYCRKVGEMPVSYRIGLLLGELNRINRARWNTLINRG